MSGTGTPVYECWVNRQKPTFTKVTTLAEVSAFVQNALLICEPGDHINIAVHTSDEYDDRDKYADGTPVPDEPS